MGRSICGVSVLTSGDCKCRGDDRNAGYRPGTWAHCGDAGKPGLARRAVRRDNLGMRPIGIDLFSGAGGLSLGFEQAGFDIAAAVDIDPVHCAVHHFNFPDTAVIPRSVDNLTATEIRDAAGIGERAVDCVFGGAPCQGFSLIGHRALDDPRNGLVRHFVRLVAELQPRTFVFRKRQGPYGRQAQVVSRRTGGRIRGYGVLGTVALEGAQCRELRHAAVARTLVRSWRARWRAGPRLP